MSSFIDVGVEEGRVFFFEKKEAKKCLRLGTAWWMQPAPSG
jgi:hypothetical protein